MASPRDDGRSRGCHSSRRAAGTSDAFFVSDYQVWSFIEIQLQEKSRNQEENYPRLQYIRKQVPLLLAVVTFMDNEIRKCAAEKNITGAKAVLKLRRRVVPNKANVGASERGSIFLRHRCRQQHRKLVKLTGITLSTENVACDITHITNVSCILMRTTLLCPTSFKDRSNGPAGEQRRSQRVSQRVRSSQGPPQRAGIADRMQASGTTPVWLLVPPS